MSKWCEEGNHMVERLFWSKKPNRKSACLSCSRKYHTPIGNYKITNKSVSSDIKHLEKRTPKEDKSIPELIKLATIVFNKWIRGRDSDFMWFKCISCQDFFLNKFSQAGHYMPSTYSELRFNEKNVHSECPTCNCQDHNHLVGYRKNLISKIGIEKVEWLESHSIANTKKWDREELLEIINKYK